MGKEIVERKDIQKFLDGDRNMNDALYEEVMKFLLSLNSKNRASLNNIKDIAQNSFIMLLLNLRADKFNYNSSLNTYAKAIAKAQFYKSLGANDKNIVKISDPSYFEDLIENEPNLVDIEQIRWKVYNEEIKNLKKECRKLLRFVADKTDYNKIAKLMGFAKQEVVRERVYRCKAKLMTLMNNNPLLKKAQNYE